MREVLCDNLEMDGEGRPRQVRQGAHPAAVNAVGTQAAERAMGRLLFGCGEDGQAWHSMQTADAMGSSALEKELTYMPGHEQMRCVLKT